MEETVGVLIDKLKSQGLFDRVRKKILADIESKSVYQDLLGDVDNYVNFYLEKQSWPPSNNKVRLRERLRQEISNDESLGFKLDSVVDNALYFENSKDLIGQINTIVHEYLSADSSGYLLKNKGSLIEMNYSRDEKFDRNTNENHSLKNPSPPRKVHVAIDGDVEMDIDSDTSPTQEKNSLSHSLTEKIEDNENKISKFQPKPQGSFLKDHFAKDHLRSTSKYNEQRDRNKYASGYKERGRQSDYRKDTSYHRSRDRDYNKKSYEYSDQRDKFFYKNRDRNRDDRSKIYDNRNNTYRDRVYRQQNSHRMPLEKQSHTNDTRAKRAIGGYVRHGSPHRRSPSSSSTGSSSNPESCRAERNYDRSTSRFTRPSEREDSKQETRRKEIEARLKTLEDVERRMLKAAKSSPQENNDLDDAYDPSCL